MTRERISLCQCLSSVKAWVRRNDAKLRTQICRRTLADCTTTVWLCVFQRCAQSRVSFVSGNTTLPNITSLKHKHAQVLRTQLPMYGIGTETIRLAGSGMSY